MDKEVVLPSSAMTVVRPCSPRVNRRYVAARTVGSCLLGATHSHKATMQI